MFILRQYFFCSYFDYQLLCGALLTQTHLTTGGVGGDADSIVIDLAMEIHQKIPKEFNIASVASKYPIMYSNSMNTVLKQVITKFSLLVFNSLQILLYPILLYIYFCNFLGDLQELVRYNRLIKIVKSTLVEVQRAVKGFVVMNSELEEVYQSMVVGRVPKAWASKSYPSLKPLGGYVSDLLARSVFKFLLEPLYDKSDFFTTELNFFYQTEIFSRLDFIWLSSGVLDIWILFHPVISDWCSTKLCSERENFN